MTGEKPHRFTALTEKIRLPEFLSLLYVSFCLIFIFEHRDLLLKEGEERESMQERKRKRLRVKTTGVCLTSLVQMLWFLRRSLCLAKSCTLITVEANSVAVFLAHTGNSSTPGSQQMVLAGLVMAALLLSCMVETPEPLAGSLPPTPG